MFGKNTAALVLALLLAGCGERPEQEAHDGLRVVAMAPNTAEILYALGLSNEVVGVSRFTTYPPEAKEKPVVGGLYDPNWEMIVALQPDLVVGLETQNEIKGQLQALGIDFLGVSHESIDDILQSILTIGNACGADAKADELFQFLERKVGQASSLSGMRGQSYNLMIPEKSLNYRTDPSGGPSGDSYRENPNDSRQDGSLSHVKKPRVLVCVGHDETLSRLYIAARGTFYDELIERAGGINACETTAGNYPEVSPEGLAVMNPDLVIDILPRLENFSSKAWKPYRAIAITNDYASIPGPRFVLLLEDFIKAIQPEERSK